MIIGQMTLLILDTETSHTRSYLCIRGSSCVCKLLRLKRARYQKHWAPPINSDRALKGSPATIIIILHVAALGRNLQRQNIFCLHKPISKSKIEWGRNFYSVWFIKLILWSVLSILIHNRRKRNKTPLYNYS